MREPVWIEESDVYLIHERVLALHGGATGTRDKGLLLSALLRPQQHFAYAENVDMHQLAAVLAHGIVANHPFVDGNKRTGFVLGTLFLEINGWMFTAPEELAAAVVIDMASGNIDEDGYARFLRDHSVPDVEADPTAWSA